MKKIYTRTGDAGKTGIFGGERVDKDDVRIEANGTLDELNTEIGVVRSLLPAEHEWHELLYEIQMELMAMMSLVATPSAKRTDPNTLRPGLVTDFERAMDGMNASMEDNGYFILPGGTQVSAHLQVARVTARRAERRLCTLHRNDPLPPLVLSFVNRLSDLFFVMARYECIAANGRKRNGGVSAISGKGCRTNRVVPEKKRVDGKLFSQFIVCCTADD